MKRGILMLFLLAIFVLPFIHIDAATLYFDPADSEVWPGGTAAVAVRLDTDEGECINVVDGTITFPQNLIPVDISLGKSILPIWIEEPVINTQNRTITFAGGIPNGYCGRISGDPQLTNILLEIIFQAPGIQIGLSELSPLATLAFTDESRALLNDGFGTEAPLRKLSGQLYVHSQPSSSSTDEWRQRIQADDIPPAEFSITLTRDPSIFAGRYFITFNTTDKQSGISHYEVIEEPLDAFNLFAWGAATTPWTEARSPYLLKDQSLNSTIRVRAYDKAGNQYVATLVPDETMRSATPREKISLAAGVAGGLLLLILIVAVLYRLHVKRRRQHQLASQLDETL